MSWEENPHNKQGSNGWRGTKAKVKQSRAGNKMGVGTAVKGPAPVNWKWILWAGHRWVSWEEFRSHSGEKIFGNLHMLQTIVGMQNKTSQNTRLCRVLMSMTSAGPCIAISVPMVGLARLSLSSPPSKCAWPGYSGTQPFPCTSLFTLVYGRTGCQTVN